MTTIALAGRRIDAPGTTPPRFPLASVRLVRDRLHEHFARLKADRLVCSAACGADLIALDVAHELGVPRCTVVLPFDPERFLRTSVLDRPGDWEAQFRAATSRAEATSDLIVLGLPEGSAAYAAANNRILEEAASGPPPTRCCMVSEGLQRGAEDHSMALADAARAKGWVVDAIQTM